MGNNKQARKRQRRNRNERRKEERLVSQKTEAQIVEDAELGRYSRLRMCTSKQGYPTELQAIKAAIDSSHTFGKPFRYYRCPHCHMWHLSTSIMEDGGQSAKAVRELNDSDAARLDSDEAAMMERALNADGQGIAGEAAPVRPLNFVERDYLCVFANKYLDLYSSCETEEHQVESSFREWCEELGFDLGCSDRFTQRYPERALYQADALKEAIGEIDDAKLLGSAIFFHWRYVTHWAEESLLSEENREWFMVALGRLKELAGG